MPATIPTTTFGTWANIMPDSSGTTPIAYVADALGNFTDDYDVEALTVAFLAELQRRLPAGLVILGNGELIGPAAGPEHDELPDDVCGHVRALIEGDEDGMGGIDFQSLMEEHDYTAGPWALQVGPRIGQGPGDYSPDSDVARFHKPAVYLYTGGADLVDAPRTLAEAKADAFDRYGQATGLGSDALRLIVLDGNDPVAQDEARPTPAAPPRDRGPALIQSINALDLIHRTITNPNGVDFHVDGLRFDAGTGVVLIEITRYDEETGDLTDDSGAVLDLAGWIIQ